MYRVWIATSAALLSLTTGSALAQRDDTNAGANTDGLYIGAGVGEFSTEIDEIGDVDNIDVDFDTDEDATKIYAGWRFNRFVAVQLDQYEFGDSTLAVNLLPLSAETEGTAASIVGTLPLGPIELFARAGVLWYDVNVDLNGRDVIDESGNDNVYSAGLGFVLADRFNIKLEYEEVHLDGVYDDANAVWISANWRF
jgi:Outer membrane protein beta-barrel domain